MDPQRSDISMLTDAALAEAAGLHRREALHGNRHAFGLAHEFERELRRRAGIVSLHDNPVPITVQAARPWWRVWGRDRPVQPRSVGR